jgi:hypothetical protein
MAVLATRGLLPSLRTDIQRALLALLLLRW